MNIDDHSHRLMRHHEVDREMEAHFRRLDQEEIEARLRLSKPSKSDVKREPMLRVKSPELAAGADDLAPNGEHEDAIGDPELDRLLADLESTPVTQGSSRASPGADPEPVDTSADGVECIFEPGPPISEPSIAETTAALADPVARVTRLVAVVPDAKLDSATSVLGRFPVASLSDVPAFDGPDRELAALCRELQTNKSYQAVRVRYCQLSIRMNLQGAMAPAFRSRPRVEAARGDPLHMLLHRDQLVIDYHWTHARQMPLSPKDVDHIHLLDLDSEFDFAAAWSLTGRKQKRAYRAAEALCLTRLQQCQTMCLQSEETAGLLASIVDGYRKSSGKSHSALAKVKVAIGEWIERDPRIKIHRISYERLWLANELLGPGVSKQSIAELHALMLGARPLDRKTIAGKLDTLKKNVAVVS